MSLGRIIIGAGGALFASAAIISAQQIPVPTARLQSSIDTVRVRAFYEVFAAAFRDAPTPPGSSGPQTAAVAARAKQQDGLATALIALLERENARIARASTAPLPENWGEGYYADLFVTVARMRDPRAVKALMPVISNGNVVQTCVADLGNAAVADLASVVESGDELNRFGAVRTLGMIARRAVELGVTPVNVNAIRKALMLGAGDRESFITRGEAVAALIVFPDEEIRPVMQDIAANDTYGRVLAGGQRVYPIRDAAAAWLRAHPR